MNLLRNRILAFLIDYILIVLYIGILASISLGIISVLEINPLVLTPITAQLLGLLTLTIPVFLYFYLSENSRKAGSLGKQKMNLRISSEGKSAIFKRNLFKLLPWKIAHSGVHWAMFYSVKELETPWWVWCLLIIPQVMVIIYIVTITNSNGRYSLYDKWAKTKLESIT